MIRRRSNRRQRDYRIYYTVTVPYIWARDDSRCLHCGRQATEIHHAKGRTGKLLSDVRYAGLINHLCHDDNARTRAFNDRFIEKITESEARYGKRTQISSDRWGAGCIATGHVEKDSIS